MSIDDPDQLEHLKAAGRVVAEAIRAMRSNRHKPSHRQRSRIRPPMR